jgi:hypothetical protein
VMLMPSIDDFEKIYGLPCYEPNLKELKREEQRRYEQFLRHPVYVTENGVTYMSRFAQAFNHIATPHPDSMAAFFLDSQDPDDDEYLPWLNI